MSVRGFVLIECDQTRVEELREVLPGLKLAGSRVVSVDIVGGRYDLIAQVESVDLFQLHR